MSWQVDADVTSEEFTPLKARLAFERDFMDVTHSELGKNAAVAPTFALIALLLSAIGLYAVITHSVTNARRRFGFLAKIRRRPSFEFRRLGRDLRPRI